MSTQKQIFVMSNRKKSKYYLELFVQKMYACSFYVYSATMSQFDLMSVTWVLFIYLIICRRRRKWKLIIFQWFISLAVITNIRFCCVLSSSFDWNIWCIRADWSSSIILQCPLIKCHGIHYFQSSVSFAIYQCECY